MQMRSQVPGRGMHHAPWSQDGCFRPSDGADDPVAHAVQDRRGGRARLEPAPAAADLNNDSLINVLDLELLARNYRGTGPVAWQ